MRILSYLAPLTALLSSSCCVVQLALNFFSFSCAGFSAFTPYRPFLTCLTVLMISYQSYQTRYRPAFVLICLALMASPEMVRWINTTSVGSAQEYSIRITGLGCEACANRIKRELQNVEWISQARVFFHNATAIVSTQNPEAVVALIESIDNRYRAQVQ